MFFPRKYAAVSRDRDFRHKNETLDKLTVSYLYSIFVMDMCFFSQKTALLTIFMLAKTFYVYVVTILNKKPLIYFTLYIVLVP